MEGLFAAIASPRRREILRLTWARERTAGEIAAQFSISWPAVSQNIRVLREAGLLQERREGTRRFYRAEQSRLARLAPVLQEMWESDLARLKKTVEQRP